MVTDCRYKGLQIFEQEETKGIKGFATEAQRHRDFFRQDEQDEQDGLCLIPTLSVHSVSLWLNHR